MEPQTKLTTIEQSELSRLEAIIEKGQQTFVEVGSAFMEIRDSGLYKMFGTFESYCKERWGYSRPRVYQLMETAKVQDNLSTVVDKPIPDRQARALIGLNAPQQQEAYKKAVDTAPDGKVTAKVAGIPSFTVLLLLWQGQDWQRSGANGRANDKTESHVLGHCRELFSSPPRGPIPFPYRF